MPYNRRKDNGSFAPIEDWIISVGEHPGVISSDLWIKCQDINKEIKERASNRECTSQEALLSGLVVCARCGSGMAPKQNMTCKHPYRYYSCNLRNKAASRCDNDAMNAYDAEDYVVNTLKSLTHEDMIKNYEEIKKKNSIKLNNKNLTNDYLKEIENNKKTISSLVMKMAYMDNDPILLDPFKLEIKNLTERNNELNFALEELNSLNGEIASIRETLDEILATLDNFKQFYDFTADFEEKKRLIRSLVKFVVWDCKTRILDVALIASDKERPKQNNLSLSGSSRRDGSC